MRSAPPPRRGGQEEAALSQPCRGGPASQAEPLLGSAFSCSSAWSQVCMVGVGSGQAGEDPKRKEALAHPF